MCVGWVEQSETQQCLILLTLGFVPQTPDASVGKPSWSLRSPTYDSLRFSNLFMYIEL